MLSGSGHLIYPLTYHDDKKSQTILANSFIQESTALFRAARPYPPFWGAYPVGSMKTKSNVYFPTGVYPYPPFWGACPNPREGGDPEY